VKRLIWGNESYTSNSDAVCILKHSGMVDLYNLPNKNYAGLSLICVVGRCKLRILCGVNNLLARRNYTSFLKNGLKSRKIGGYMVCSHSISLYVHRDSV